MVANTAPPPDTTQDTPTHLVIQTGPSNHERIYASRNGNGKWLFTGATYPHKGTFRAAGAEWNREVMSWTYFGINLPDAIKKLGTVSPLHIGSPPPQTDSTSPLRPRIERVVEEKIVEVEKVVEKPVPVYRNLTYRRKSGRKMAARKWERKTPAAKSQGFVPPSYWERLTLYLTPGISRPAIAMVGPAGNGKTTTAEEAFKALGYDYIVIDANDRMEAADLVGAMTFRQQDGNASEVWRDGPVAKAFREGKAILINEFDALDPRAAMCLQSVMQDAGKDRTGRYVTLPGNPDEDRIYPNGDCPLVLTMNTFGDGPNREYVGRNSLDAASKDRITIIDTGYENEDKILMAKGFTSTTAQDLVKWATEMRRRIDRDGLRIILSNRTLIRMAQAMEVYGWTFKQTVEREFLSRFSEAERKYLQEGK
jgi:hypothetical protein